MVIHHVVTSEQTGLRARWYNEAHCVACGIVIDRLTIEEALDKGLCPCCDTCQSIVREEQALDFPMWPTHFHGHWLKTSSEGVWLSE